MKMKSKFFGLNAKLALAVLAVGTMFTGCYDSENGDVTKPYQPLPASYYVMGTITDAETGETLTDATVTVNGASVSLTDGSYSTEAKVGTNTVTVQHADYNNGELVKRTIDIKAVEDGQSYTAVVNVALTPNAVAPEREVEVKVVTTVNREEFKFDKDGKYGQEPAPGLDLMAEEEAAVFTRNFDVEAGYDFVMNPENPSEEMLAYVQNYLGVNNGKSEVETITVPYTFQIPSWNALDYVSITYMYVTTTYTFTSSENETCVVNVNGITGYAFGTAFIPNHNYSHSHGHGHGHGDNINAGGGILTPEM